MRFQSQVSVRCVEMETEQEEIAWRAGMALLWTLLVEYEESQRNQPLIAVPTGTSSKGSYETNNE